jgi:hypothetical protein
VIVRLQQEIHDCEDKLYCQGNDNCKCMQCLEKAHISGHMFKEVEITNGLRVITPWVLEHGCST